MNFMMMNFKNTYSDQLSFCLADSDWCTHTIIYISRIKSKIQEIRKSNEEYKKSQTERYKKLLEAQSQKSLELRDDYIRAANERLETVKSKINVSAANDKELFAELADMIRVFRSVRREYEKNYSFIL